MNRLISRLFALLSAAVISLSARAGIAAAEYFINSDPGQGNGTALPIAAPGAPIPVAVPPAVIAALSNGTHVLVCRLMDDEGNWSIAFARPFFKDDADLEPQALVERFQLQWFRDNSPVEAPSSLDGAPARELSLAESLNLASFTTGDYRLLVTPFDTLGRRGFAVAAETRLQEARQLQLGSAQVLADGTIRLELAGAEGLRLLIQASTDLVEWTDVSWVDVNTQSAEIRIAPDGAAARFFRTVIP